MSTILHPSLISQHLQPTLPPRPPPRPPPQMLYPGKTTTSFSVQTWQKRYLVLRDNTVDKGSRLEICSSKENWADRLKKNCDKDVLDLRGSCVVSEYKRSKSFPFAFTLTRKGHASLILGAETEHELKQWMCAINLLTSKGPLHCHHSSTNSIFRDSVNGNASQRSEMISPQQGKRRSLHESSSLGLQDKTNNRSDFPHALDKWIIPAKGSRAGSTTSNSEYSSIYRGNPSTHLSSNAVAASGASFRVFTFYGAAVVLYLCCLRTKNQDCLRLGTQASNPVISTKGYQFVPHFFAHRSKRTSTAQLILT